MYNNLNFIPQRTASRNSGIVIDRLNPPMCPPSFVVITNNLINRRFQTFMVGVLITLFPATAKANVEFHFDGVSAIKGLGPGCSSNLTRASVIVPWLNSATRTRSGMRSSPSELRLRYNSAVQDIKQVAILASAQAIVNSPQATGKRTMPEFRKPCSFSLATSAFLEAFQ